MTRVRRALCILAPVVLFAIVFAPAAATAQIATAELNGRVTDSSGAVLPGVTVTATQTATGLARTAVTDGDGAYLLSNLPPGPYRLEVSLQGFRAYVQTGLVLHGRRDADGQRRPRARLARGDGHGGSGGAARGRPQRRDQFGRRERADRRVAAPGPNQVTACSWFGRGGANGRRRRIGRAPGGVRISVAGGLRDRRRATPSTARRTTTRRRTSTCRCRFPTRSRSSAWRRAACPPRTASSRRRRSTP